MQEVILFYNGLDVPTRQILDSKGGITTKTVVDAKVAIQEMAKYNQKWHNGTFRTRSTETSDGLAVIQAQLNNLGREIKKVNEKVYAAQVGCKQCKGPHYTQDCPIKEEGKTLDEAYYTQSSAPFQQGGQYRAAAPVFYQRNNANPSSTKTNPGDHVKSISTTVEADMTPIRCVGSSQYVVSAQQNNKLIFESRQMTIPFPSCLNDYYCDGKKGSYGLQCLDTYSYEATRIDDSLPQKEKDPGSFTLPCYINNACFQSSLADLGASVSVMPLSTSRPIDLLCSFLLFDCLEIFRNYLS
ncbi:ribonuclease H-like domain-containing protein [Tanacetum coccineum]